MLKTKNILLFFILFLIGTNIATILIYQRHIDRDRNVMKYRMELPDQQMGKYLNKEFNLTDDQINNFKKFRRKYNRGANSILNDMQQIRAQMLEILKSTIPNEKEYHDLANDLGNKHHDLKILTFQYYSNMLGELPDSQKNKMSEIFEAMLTHEGNAKTPKYYDSYFEVGGKTSKETNLHIKMGKDSLMFEKFTQ